MKIASLSFLALASMAAVACSSSNSTGGTAAPANPDKGIGGDGDTMAAAAPDKNPDGVPYPTANIGTNARAGATAGNTLANYKVLGYPDGDTTKGLQPISMATLFDPTGMRVKLIHIQASGSWCVYCQEETKTIAPMRQMLADRKVAWIISLAEGPTPGSPSTATDLNKWVSQFKAPYTHLLDPANKNFGPFYDAAALPWNANIDAKTMEILSSGVGATTTQQAILDDLDLWIKTIDSAK
ncbi:MAG: hypothetical protein NVS3B10_05310 [Polyangiales bacterium]